jgi:ATP-dependent protease HslVU (ClpYQ) peptidase subunit
VPALREAFKADMDLQDTNSGKYPDLGMLVGVKGRLYEFHSDFQFGRPRDGFTALGSGGDVAQGALYASAKRPVRERLLTALNAAERYTTFVRAPFTIVSI